MADISSCPENTQGHNGAKLAEWQKHLPSGGRETTFSLR